jgi:uncharacterized protein (TIGR00290 family)
MQKVFTSWSSGKDGCYACYMAMNSGLDVKYLLNMMDAKEEWSWVHRIPLKVLEQQAEAMGLTLAHGPSTPDTYEDDYTAVISRLKKYGVEGGVFGDIDGDDHRKWVEDICERSGIEAYLPLWHLSQDDILADFIKQGFEAVIVACNEKYLGEEFLGRKIDNDFVSELSEMAKTTDITACGENGEFHTLVISGPIFNRKIELRETVNRYNNGYWFLEISKSRLVDK